MENDKSIFNLLNSLINSGDLKLKVSIKDKDYECIATATLNYKGRKIDSKKYSLTRYEEEV